MTVASIVVVLFLAAGRSALAANPGDYVGAAACKECHAKHYAAWEKTKHAVAISRLSTAERKEDCVGCHVTGGAPLQDDGANANVQCEQCHGAGRAHVDAAGGGAAKPGSIVAKPAEAGCVACHSAKSPHFKFFSYGALAPLVHPGAK